MDRIINQLKRLYDDYGANDRDFTPEETRLKAAQDRLVDATKELIKSSESLNIAAINAQRGNRPIH